MPNGGEQSGFDASTSIQRRCDTHHTISHLLEQESRGGLCGCNLWVEQEKAYTLNRTNNLILTQDGSAAYLKRRINIMRSKKMKDGNTVIKIWWISDWGKSDKRYGLTYDSTQKLEEDFFSFSFDKAIWFSTEEERDTAFNKTESGW